MNKGDLADERADNLMKIVTESGANAVKINAVNAGSKRDITGQSKNWLRKSAPARLKKVITKFSVLWLLVCRIPASLRL